MTKEEFEKAKKKRNELAVDRLYRLRCIAVLEKIDANGFNKTKKGGQFLAMIAKIMEWEQDWAYDFRQKEIEIERKFRKSNYREKMNLESQLAIALEALEKARVTIHCSTKSGKYCSLESIKPVNDALTKIRGEL